MMSLNSLINLDIEIIKTRIVSKYHTNNLLLRLVKMLHFFKDNAETTSSLTLMLLIYQSAPVTPILPSQSSASTPKNRKADDCASEHRRPQYIVGVLDQVELENEPPLSFFA